MILVHTVNLTICGPGPLQVLKEQREEPRWCFGCRKRLGGTSKCYSEIGMSWYDPWWQYECDGCGQDRRLFPGWEWSSDE